MNQVTLTLSEVEALQAHCLLHGKTQEEVVHEAIDQFLVRNIRENRLAALRKARGIWKDRDAPPDFDELRNEWERQSL